MATRQEKWASRAATRSLRLRMSMAVFTVGVLGMVAVTQLPTSTDVTSSSSGAVPLAGATESSWSLRGGLRRLHTNTSSNATTASDDDLGSCPWRSANSDALPTCTLDDKEACCGDGGYPSDDGADDDESGGGGAGKLIYSILLLFYMFLGIAILCDELFVPALEIIADKWELSNDVAGATLMAAGGSAPELFTSLFGAFARSEVGFSTIVGSAVFNVLFVIGMCAMFTPAKFSPLKLTWWPLARDCSYYILTLITLVVWMSDGKVELYEALLQFAMYGGYVLLMAKSEKLEAAVKDYLARSAKVAQSPVGNGGKAKAAAAVEDARYEPTAGRPSTFRASVLQMMTNKGTTAEATGVALVTRIKGDVNEVFDKLDENNNGQLDKSELKELLRALGVDERELTDESVHKMQTEINGGPEGDVISKEQFTVWYAKSETRLTNEMKTCFAKIDTNKSGTIDKDEIRALLAELGHSVSDEEVDDVEKAIAHHPETGQITFPDFREWYSSSLLYDQKREQADSAVEAIESMWSGVLQGLEEVKSPDMPLGAKISFFLTLPLTLLCCLVPDCRPPGKENYCYATFVGSIVGIGGFSYVMVEMATNVGNVLKIPVYIMGITIIAAGTSVPDLLSSVIVAKQGHGDMAVSSSVGSNIFDVTVGIPLPWIMFSIYTSAYDCTYGNLVNEADLLLPTCILLFMVFVIVLTIAACKWEMTHALGQLMFGFYVGYLVFAILQEYCFHISLSI